MPTTKHQIVASLTDAEFGELAAMAQKYDVSLSWLSRKAILEFIDRNRTKRIQLMLGLESSQPSRTGSNLTGDLGA